MAHFILVFLLLYIVVWSCLICKATHQYLFHKQFFNNWLDRPDNSNEYFANLIKITFFINYNLYNITQMTSNHFSHKSVYFLQQNLHISKAKLDAVSVTGRNFINTITAFVTVTSRICSDTVAARKTVYLAAMVDCASFRLASSTFQVTVGKVLA
jgi:hypothetical protein